MTQPPAPQSTPPPEQLPWGISYLREDIQDLRQDLRENIQGIRQEIQETHQRFHQEIQEVRQEVRQEIQGVRQDVRHELQEVRQEMRSLRDHLDARFTWAIAPMVAMAGVIVAVIKL